MTIAPEQTTQTSPPPSGVSPAWIWVAVTAILAALVAVAALWIGDGDRAEPGDIVGSGTIATRSFDVTDFSGIRINSVADVQLTQGPETSVVVTTDQNLIEYLDVSVNNDRLVIDKATEARNRDLRPTQGIRFEVVTANVEELRVYGVGSFEAGVLATPELEIFISGVGRVGISDLDADRLVTESTGVANIDIAGAVQEQRVRWTGVGNFDGSELVVEQADITATGAGSITVWVTDRLEVRSTGSTDVEYYGTPRVDSTVTGVGDLRSLGGK
jgi:hypothetical protein